MDKCLQPSILSLRIDLILNDWFPIAYRFDTPPLRIDLILSIAYRFDTDLKGFKEKK